MIEAITQFDFAILDWITAHLKCAFLDVVMPIITMLGDKGIFWIAVAVIFVFTKKYRKVGIMMGFAFIFGVLIGNALLKPIVARIRPYDIRTGIDLLVKALSDFSFPSGHTLVCFEAATVLMLTERKKFGIAALIIAFLVAFSRLYLYVHYPTDVFAGMILGIAFGLAGYFLGGFLCKKIKEKHPGFCE